jgi:hypothetical protein
LSGYSNQFGQQGRFRESLKYEDIIHNQVEAIRQIFNRGDPTEIMYAVDALGDLITPNIADEDFLAQLQELDDEWEDEKVKMEKEFQMNLRKARGGCPDLVDKPSVRPPTEHFKRKFFIINSLLERKNLGLKIQTEAYD